MAESPLSIVHPYFAKTPQSGKVYHYTSIEGARGIITRGELWASDLHYMNDYSEVTHGINYFQQILREKAKKVIPEEQSEILYRAANYIESEALKRQIFATSFCGNDDLLSQWRGYADGGIAIGFSYNNLVQATNGKNFLLHKCVYKKCKKEDIGRRIVELASGEGAFNFSSEWNAESVVKSIGFFALMVGALFKNEHFKEEKEWRLVSWPDFEVDSNKLDFRTRARALLPYYKVKFEPDHANNCDKSACHPIKDIVIGPRGSDREADQLKAAFTNLCVWKGVQCVCVRKSDIPYRGF